MSPDEYREELIRRGFRFFTKKNLWVGPYNVQLTGQLNWDKRSFADSARVEELAVIDEKLRAKRCLPRPNSSGGPGAGLL
jgi:hypothetical protein